MRTSSLCMSIEMTVLQTEREMGRRFRKRVEKEEEAEEAHAKKAKIRNQSANRTMTVNVQKSYRRMPG